MKIIIKSAIISGFLDATKVPQSNNRTCYFTLLVGFTETERMKQFRCNLILGIMRQQRGVLKWQGVIEHNQRYFSFHRRQGGEPKPSENNGRGLVPDPAKSLNVA